MDVTTIHLSEIVLFILSVCMTCFGWFLRQIWSAVDALRRDAASMREELPKTYMPAARMDMIFNKLDAKLDRLMDKIDLKADKP